MKKLQYRVYLARFRNKTWHCWYSKKGLSIVAQWNDLKSLRAKNRIGRIIGESHDKKYWLIEWSDKKTIYRSPKEFIKYKIS